MVFGRESGACHAGALLGGDDLAAFDVRSVGARAGAGVAGAGQGRRVAVDGVVGAVASVHSALRQVGLLPDAGEVGAGKDVDAEEGFEQVEEDERGQSGDEDAATS